MVFIPNISILADNNLLTQNECCNIIWEENYGGQDFEIINDLFNITNNQFLATGISGSIGKPWESTWIIKGNIEGKIVGEKIKGIDYYNSGNVIIPAPGEYFLIGGEKNWLYCSGCNESGESWLAMIDSELNTKWEKSFNLEGNSSILSMSSNSNNGFSLAGLSQIDRTGSSNAWFAYADWDGNIIWNKSFDYLYQDKATSIFDLADNGFLIAGYSQTNNLSKSVAWILKTDNQGEIEWKKEFETSLGINIFAKIIKADIDNFLIIGYTSAKGAGWQDGWVIKIDEDGQVIWDKTFGGNNKDIFTSAIKQNNNYIIAGTTHAVDKDSGDGWVIKIDEDGQVIWDKTFGGNNKDIIKGIKAQDTKTIYLYGRTSPNQDNQLDEDGWIVKMNLN